MSKKTYIGENGYRRFKSSHKAVHHWIAEKKYGKYDKKKCVIHHLDGNKS